MSYKRWLLVAIFLFTIGLVSGLVTPASTADLSSEEIAAFEGLADLLATLPKTAVLAIIFFKNVTALLISFAFSPFFCLLPVMALTLNGWIIGLVSTAVVQEQSLGFLLAGLLPHGIFELPALFMGGAAALSFGAMVTVALFKKEKRKLVLPNLRQNLRYLAIAFVLLLPAAIIETYVTPLLLSQ